MLLPVQCDGSTPLDPLKIDVAVQLLLPTRCIPSTYVCSALQPKHSSLCFLFPPHRKWWSSWIRMRQRAEQSCPCSIIIIPVNFSISLIEILANHPTVSDAARSFRFQSGETFLCRLQVKNRYSMRIPQAKGSRAFLGEIPYTLTDVSAVAMLNLTLDAPQDAAGACLVYFLVVELLKHWMKNRWVLRLPVAAKRRRAKTRTQPMRNEGS